MPCEIIWEEHGVYKRFSGLVSYAEYRRSQERVLADARTDSLRYNSLRYIINDASAIEGFVGTADDAEESAAFNYATSLSNPAMRIAFVTSDFRLIAMVKVASVLSSFPLKCFATLEAARAWAMEGLPPTRAASAT